MCSGRGSDYLLVNINIIKLLTVNEHIKNAHIIKIRRREMSVFSCCYCIKECDIIMHFVFGGRKKRIYDSFCIVFCLIVLLKTDSTR